MITFTGNGISGSVAAGRIWILQKNSERVKRTHIENSEAEIARFEKAKTDTISELQDIYEKTLTEAGKTNARIFEVHQMLLRDQNYNETVIDLIRTRMVCAESAVSAASDKFAAMLASTEDTDIKERAADIKDISDRLIAHLSGHLIEKMPAQPRATGNNNADFPDMVICADDLTPSETVLLDKSKVRAFVTAHGSSNSHTAILSRAMDIPAVVGIGSDFLKQVKNGDSVIVDGNTGMVYVDPDEATIAEMTEKQQKEARSRKLLQELKGKPDVTLDGTSVHICANIGSVSDVDAVLANDANGIGLFRSEYLYLESNAYPTEEAQFLAYKKVLERMGGKRVIIRTLDIGADKQADYFHLPHEENPAMGLRAIRLCLSRPDLFKTQLRALYRASVYGNLGILFPMIAAVSELRAVLQIVDEVKTGLAADDLQYSDQVALGIMIETPAAALLSDELAPLVDFFSVGTNDLAQYTLAADRRNPQLEYLRSGDQTAILKLIALAVENAHANRAWIGICGEMAADCTLTETFLKMGIDELSVSPGYVLKVRDAIRKIRLT